MTDRRLELQAKLEQILGSSNVYFEPPTSTRMRYPAIVYSRNDLRIHHADNHLYVGKVAYQVTYISDDPDAGAYSGNNVFERLAELPLCRFSRHYTMDNLHHDTFNLYY